MEIESTKCSYCGNTVPQAKFLQIQARIRAEEKQKLADQAKKLALAEANLKREYEERSKLQVESELKKIADKERKAADLRIKQETSKLLSERDGALQKLKAVQANEATLKKQMAEDTDRAVKKAIEAERRTAMERTKAETRKLQTERDAALQKVKTAEAREVALKKQMAEQSELTLKKELDRQRAVLDRDRDQRERRLVAEHARKVESIEKRVGLLQRQLQEKTANELGDGAEIDLYEELHARFPSDNIKRTRSITRDNLAERSYTIRRIAKVGKMNTPQSCASIKLMWERSTQFFQPAPSLVEKRNYASETMS